MLNTMTILEIHFYNEQTVSIFSRSNHRGAERQIDFMTMISYFTRILCISEPSEQAKFCYMINEISMNQSNIDFIINRFGCNICKYPGYPADKKIVFTLNIFRNKFNFTYSVDFHGFGFFIFKKGLGYYCPVSVFLLIKSFFNKYMYDYSYIDALCDGMMCCVAACNQGLANNSNQIPIVTTAMKYVIAHGNAVGL